MVQDHTASLSKEVPDPLARRQNDGLKKELQVMDREDRVTFEGSIWWKVHHFKGLGGISPSACQYFICLLHFLKRLLRPALKTNCPFAASQRAASFQS